MLSTGNLKSPFNKLPPDGPLQITKFEPISQKFILNKREKVLQENNAMTTESLQMELLRYKEREKYLLEELMVRCMKSSAKIINEQDLLISELRKGKNSPNEDIEYLENFTNAAKFLAWSSEMIFDTCQTEESPSMDDINP